VDAIDVLVVGAGPVGLTAAAELRRHGVAARIVDLLPTPPQYAKAVGIQPRTLEVFEDMGLVDAVLDAAVPIRGQIVFRDGVEVGRMDLELPPEAPFDFACLPQYETERLLSEHLERLGGRVERPLEVTALRDDGDGLEAVLAGPDAEERLRARYVVGCDGAHSVVRRAIGASFEGDRFPEEYMLGDVVVDWSFPQGYGLRATRAMEGGGEDLLVCIPLPGRGRYRMSMLVPPELAGSDVDHGFASDRPTPELRHIQAALDRLAPEPVTARDMRWSSVFRISHRIVDRYSAGRAFVCGDAAHIHPPTGGQGMNTGIQDAYNLAWKLALAVRGEAAPGLLESYDAERRPVGEEVVGRTVRHARQGFGGADGTDMRAIVLREAQLLVGYPDSPLVTGEAGDAGPAPGERAPDAAGLRTALARFPQRLFSLLRGPEHVVLLYADAPGDAAGLDGLAAAARERARGRLRAYAVLPDGVDARDPAVPVVRDVEGRFAAAYGARGTGAWLIRPDGYVGHRSAPASRDGLLDALGRVFA
jgi:2-polyprenyl-6-methoxyphenol hydroxylase-like FAD-dependent oxidoreductase